MTFWGGATGASHECGAVGGHSGRVGILQHRHGVRELHKQTNKQTNKQTITTTLSVMESL